MICWRVTDNVNLFVVFDLNRFVPIRPGISFEFLSHETFGHDVMGDGSCLEFFRLSGLVFHCSANYWHFIGCFMWAQSWSLECVCVGRSNKRAKGRRRGGRTEHRKKVSHQVCIFHFVVSFSRLFHHDSINKIPRLSFTDEKNKEEKFCLLLIISPLLFFISGSFLCCVYERRSEMMKSPVESFSFLSGSGRNVESLWEQ